MKTRSYWRYSAALAIVWALNLGLSSVVDSADRHRSRRLVFYGFALGWVSTTIARYVYPPPKKWLQAPNDATDESSRRA